MATTEWESITIGQNKKIQEVVSAAAKASDLLNANVALAKGGLQAAQVFIQGILNPKILLLTAIADEIDRFVEDLKGTGFFILECANPEDYLIPEDADGNPIELILSAPIIAIKMASAGAVGNLGKCMITKAGSPHGDSATLTDKELLKPDGKQYLTAAACEAAGGKWDMSKTGGIAGEFGAWAKEFLGEEDIFLTGAQKAEYKVKQGKSKPADKADTNANDNKFAEKDETTGLYKMTPSQMIATMVGAMDDKLDKRRPTFTSSAEAGAIVFIVGISDMTKNLANLKSIVDAFKVFFGGDTGLLTGGVKNLGGLIEGVVGPGGWVDEPEKNEVKLIVKNVCGVRGDEDDQIKCVDAGIAYNFPMVFEENDFVVGPRVKFGARVQGWVSKVIETEEDEKYSTQKLVITGVSNSDATGFRMLGSGAKLQRVAYKQRTGKFVDQNSGAVRETGPFNDYNLVLDMDNDSAADDFKYENPKKAVIKVKREAGSTLLTEVGTADITEEHTYHSRHHSVEHSSSTFITRNTVQGDILKIVDDKKAPPPNFKSAKLEDLIGEFTTFFASIQMLTDTLRNIAAGSGEALEAIIKFLDSKIKELEEINAALQKILSLFTVGLPNAGIYTLVIPPAVGGNDYIKAELQGAKNKPPDNLEFTFGFMMVGGGASTKVLQTLLTASSA